MLLQQDPSLDVSNGTITTVLYNDKRGIPNLVHAVTSSHCDAQAATETCSGGVCAYVRLCAVQTAHNVYTCAHRLEQCTTTAWLPHSLLLLQALKGQSLKNMKLVKNV